MRANATSAAAERALSALGDTDIGNDAIYLSHELATGLIARLSKDERKQKVRELKHEREQEIINAKKNYYVNKDNNRDS